MGPASTTSARWQRLDEIFARAMELAAVEREPYVRRSCGEDGELYAEVMALLACTAEAEGSLRTVIGDGLTALTGRDR